MAKSLAGGQPGPQHNGALQSTVGVEKSNDQAIDGLLSGTAWTSAITYSDPNAPADYGSEWTYWSDEDGDGVSAQDDGFAKLDAKQTIALHFALNANDLGQGKAAAAFSVEGFTKLKISYAGAGAATASIRAANTEDYEGAYAFVPDTSVYGGDAWFGPSSVGSTPGAFSWFVILHEIGHTLGLKHGHETGEYGAVPAAVDSLEYTVMTYRTYVGDAPGPANFEPWGAPQSFMMLDIAALQHMYGADYSANGGDTVYSWSPTDGKTFVNGVAAVAPGANRVFLTVWDGGGEDTYDLSNYASDLVLDLRPGKHSVFSEAQLADLGGGANGGFARGNLFNALLHEGDTRSLIENAAGGVGDDRIIGNVGGNELTGGAGADTLSGGAGDDTLRGGSGQDDLRGNGGRDELSGGSGDDILAGNAGADLLVGGRGSDVFDFNSLSASPSAARDRIKGGGGAAAFQGAGQAGGDRIDVSDIDANTGADGSQAFKWGGVTKSGTGYLHLKDVGTETRVYGNADGDAAPELVIRIQDGDVLASSYIAADFLL